MLEPTRRVRFTRAALRQANIRGKEYQSLGKIRVRNPHQRSPCAVRFEERSPGETAGQERCARGDAWELAKKKISAKKEDKATFYPPSVERMSPAASTIKPEEREFVVDSGVSMHTVSKKYLDSAELETVRISKTSDDGDDSQRRVLAKEEATVYVRERELDLFVTIHRQFFHLEKLCEEFGYSYHWTSGRNHISSRKARNSLRHVPFVVPGLSTSSSSSSTSPTSSSQETVTDTEIPATRRSEKASEDSSARGISWHESTEIENPQKMTTRNYRVVSCKVCRICFGV